MREGRSGLYVSADGALGYSVCMLHKNRMNSWYRDPYLLAMYRESGVEDAIEDPWFTGYESQQRWMHLKASGTGLRSVVEGLALVAPTDASQAEIFARVCGRFGVGGDLVLRVSQVDREGRTLDTGDRVQVGASLLRELANAGL